MDNTTMSENVNTLPRRQSPRYINDYAHISVKLRIPVILTKIIDHLSQKRIEFINDKITDVSDDIKELLSMLSELRYRIQTNKEIRPFVDNCSLSPAWNKMLASFKRTPTWFEVSWLYIECYFYACIQESVDMCQTLSTMDVFRHLKERSFIESFSAIQTITDWSSDVMTAATPNRDHFKRIMQLCLWGNRFDLSISAGQDNHNTDYNPVEKLSDMEADLLHSDVDQVYDLLMSKGGLASVDIVLDNAGYELVSDLVLAVYLVHTGMVSDVRVHCKEIPWFVSDVTVLDFHWTLERFAECKKLHKFQNILRDVIKEAKLTVEVHSFWTTPFSFQDMAAISPDLFQMFNNSTLVVYKGDLNYRKLVDDRNWIPYETTLEQALSCRGECPKVGAIVALRTIKSQPLVGVTREQYDHMKEQDDKWYCSGRFGLIQFVDWSKRTVAADEPKIKKSFEDAVADCENFLYYPTDINEEEMVIPGYDGTDTANRIST